MILVDGPTASAVPGPPSGEPVGEGSFAPTPPDYLGQKYQDIVNRPLYIEKTLSGEPVPTNGWETDLLVSKYSGDLWANPLVVSNSEEGTTLRYPTRWNEEGTQRVLESPIVVGGMTEPTPAPSDLVMADFEGGNLPEGWTETGDAFDAPASGTAPGQIEVNGMLGKGLLNSFTATKGDGATGLLTSPEFTVDRDWIVFKVAGGAHVDNEEVRLVIDGETVRTSSGENSENLRWVTWDMGDLKGRTAHLEVVDNLEAGWAHILVDQIMRTDDTAGLEERFGTAFRPENAKAAAWGEWNLTWRMAAEDGGPHVDVTAARGIPYTYFEFSGVAPRITLSDKAKITDGDGQELTFPITVDRFVVEQDGRRFGVHAPDTAAFERAGRILTVSGADYLVFSAIPAEGASLDDMHAHAFALPQNTKMEYTYDPEKAKVVQSWSVETRALEGSNLDTVQGFLPHHYRGTENDIQFTGSTYDVPRGLMKMSIGHDAWTMSYDFEGIAPIAPTPLELGGENDYQLNVMRDYVRDYAKRTEYGADTYWGAKTLQEWAQYMLAAKQIGEMGAYEKIKSSLRTALEDWYTYTDGETGHFFARYPTWKALIGFGESYQSAEFTDNHFHYGYFALASALLAFEDPEWAAGYGDMATLVAKQYANWDRSDKDFPYLRTFDTWEGHSYAGGTSSPGGNNQESSSEAIQSWYGLFLLGTALGNTDMQATGAMGFATERQAVLEYYLDYHGSESASEPNGEGVFPEQYDHTTTGILYDNGQGFGTYFSGDPGWIYGIQWLPLGQQLDYLAWDKNFSRSLMQDMFDLRPHEIGQNTTIGENGSRLQMAVKKWYGIGTYGDVVITKDRPAALEEIKGAVRAAELNNPGWVTERRVADNPFYDSANNAFFVSRAADGTLVFPAQYWTEETLPAALVPVAVAKEEVNKPPREWSVDYPVGNALSMKYEADTDAATLLHSIDMKNYTIGKDTAHAADVFSRIGDALGNVLLGMVAQYDPEVYADIHAELLRRGDAVATSTSMAGLVYYKAMANRTVGTPAPERWTSSPTSQVYYDAKSDTYSYVIYNPSDTQQRYQVYDRGTVIGTIDVPGRSQVTHHLDAALAKIEVTGDTTARTVEPGSTVQYSATAFDQYGAVIELDDVIWETDGGTIGADGSFTAGDERENATIRARSGKIIGSATLRIGATPVLTSISVSPGFAQIVVDASTAFTADGRDQYGDPIELGGEVTWEYTGRGTISGGTVSATAPGSGHVVAHLGELEGSAVAATVAPLSNMAINSVPTASSIEGYNSPQFATDGDAGTRWESKQGNDNEWLMLDLGNRYDVDSVRVDWEGAAAARYELQFADSPAGPWVSTMVEKANADDDVVDVATTARYVRLQGISRLTGYGYSLYEFEVYGTRSASDIEPQVVLIAPRLTTVASGRSTTLGAYAFDALGHGGTIDAVWAATGGVGAVDPATGVFDSGSENGTAAITASYKGISGEAEVIVDRRASTIQPERNIAVGKNVTASSSESSNFDGTFAVDGIDTTRWASEASDAQSFEIDLGEIVPITKIALNWEAAYASQYTLEVRASESDPWREIVTEESGHAGRAEYAVPEEHARYVRLAAVTRATSWGYSLWEFQVYSREGAPQPDLALNRPTVASSTQGEFAPTGATDGNIGTRWASEWTDNEWLQVELAAAVKPSTAELKWEDAFGKSYVLEGALTADGPWTELAKVVDGDGGDDRVSLDTADAAKFLRVRGLERGTGYGYSLISLTVR
ncbi:discoidin domain-containing protein [Herbiconiux daphne]|uniref:glucan endo-1,3-beta-D-glucosidase n=1 Tax=Herbiconiux daphne TaxID=2970914 RepID=A0ABT2H550_9MICO|nr:discoidin domain-containing protein [Herbiconiux daphne]MCS5735067.1 discoidin domain-containing protein [Herbiconiux daphne]